jgi:hypothetical protein
MRRYAVLVGLALGSGIIALGCGAFSIVDPPAQTDATDGDPPQPTEGEAGDSVTITHAFGAGMLQPFEEITPCVSWTLDNDEPLYVQTVTLSNEGSFHHSNWFVVPEEAFSGNDGWWSCSSRGFNELTAAQMGTVLFAQSTQSYTESQRLADGAVIKIPPRSRVVADVHLLNLAPREVRTQLWLSLELLHPRDVDVVVTPFRLTYYDLDIPALSASHHTGECDLATRHESITGEPLQLELHYVLPHYHALGNYFDLTVSGGSRDGESIYRLDGFNAEPNGKTFDPPLDLGDARGLRFTCGYDNWYDQDIGWGFGIQEMCVMLGLAKADLIFDGTVLSGSRIVDVVDGVRMVEGSCLVLSYTRQANQGPPTPEEIDGPLYVPPVNPADADIPPVPECRDVDPAAAPSIDATLSSLREQLFVPACTFSACHGHGAVAGLDLLADDLHATLLDHDVVANTDLPLVSPGDPSNSWLYRLLAQCDPTDRDGNPVPHMPRNAPFLLDDDIVAAVRTWIEDGAVAD